MLQKDSKPTFIKFIKKSAAVLFVLEAASFGVTYGVWYRMNTNREFRQYMSENFPIVLDSYYKFGELMGGDSAQIRNIDETYWKHTPKPSTSN